MVQYYYVQRARQRRAAQLPWIANPFTKLHTHPNLSNHDQPIMTLQSPQDKRGASTEDVIGPVNGPTKKQEVKEIEDVAEAEEVEEATPIELFYDLFFVANLTTVTSVHYITESKTLSSYILYFIILWFTWLHVTLLDVRFSVDSVYERVCKALHFAVMGAFASVSTTWDPFSPDDDITITALKTMTLTLMFSRVILSIQYFVVMYFGRSKTRTILPLAIHGAVMIISASVYLGIYFSFRHGHTEKYYLSWYIMAAFEVISVITTSSIWGCVSFKRTHLIERMGLLTLIILGEGIIVMLKAINTIVKGFGWTWTTLGVVSSSIALIYLYWMFYFDFNPMKIYYGRFRQQLWALLHFPFHLAIVLSVEGLRQLATLRNYELMADDMMGKFTGPTRPNNRSQMIDQFNNAFALFYNDDYANTVLKEWPIVTNWTNELETFMYDSILQDGDREFMEAYSDLYNALVAKLAYYLSEFYGFKFPYRKPEDTGDRFSGFRQLFDLVFKYFFLSLGVVFVMYGVFAILVRRRLDVYDWICVGLRFTPAVVFFAMSEVSSTSPLYSSGGGSWPIPQVCVLIFIILLSDKATQWFGVWRSGR
ncbi:bacterial low temperature requirement A protein-domain-containing protein [Morchella snyderi]|nr:bacterial low temperature requirement A protein-domain-containing protein [Morchella snyderi]